MGWLQKPSVGDYFLSSPAQDDNILVLGLYVFHDIEVPTPTGDNVVEAVICFFIVSLMRELGQGVRVVRNK